MRVSLAAVGNWIRSLGRLEPRVAFAEGIPMPLRSFPRPPEIMELLAAAKETPNGDGRVQATGRTINIIRHPAQLSLTPVEEGYAPLKLNAHRPVWR